MSDTTGTLTAKNWGKTWRDHSATITRPDGSTITASASATQLKNSNVGDTVKLCPTPDGGYNYLTVQNIAPIRFNRHTPAVGWE